MSTTTPHVLVIASPQQGHVTPLLEFSQSLAKLGCRVTFVITEYYHKRILKSLEGKNFFEEKIHLASIPDGMEPWEDRRDFGKLIKRYLQVIPGKFEELIEEINGREDEKISCLIADANMGWVMGLADKKKIKGAVVWPSSAASVALASSIAKLIDDGIINSDGTPMKKVTIQLAPNMPAINSANLFWACIGDLAAEKNLFHLTCDNIRAMKLAGFRFCNSTHDLEPVAFTIVPDLLPIGPLLESNGLGNLAGCLEDSNCLNWLDQQQPNSVIYVSFGTTTIFDKIQFQELALGLELCNRPFLWALRPNITNDGDVAYPEGFEDRIATFGRMISWAPQPKVLSHPSIACFLSHCGWNSTMEGVSNGVPFLCWPYFTDQKLNATYISEIWKVGLGFNKNENGIITREEIKNKMEQVLGDENFKSRALELKEKVLNRVREGGSSNKTFQDFLEWIKDEKQN